MNFETSHKVENTVERLEGRNYIESDGSMSVKDCNDFWKQKFDGVGEYSEDAEKASEKSDKSEVEQSTKTFSNLEDMKVELGESYKKIKETKPMNSPNIAKWLDKGGQIEISEQDGKRVWTYINTEGIAVKYVDGYPVFSSETKHPDIKDLSIGEFTGDRKKDTRVYLEVLEEEYGLTEIPEGYELHHDSENGTMQLVKEEYHKEFTHSGGHSKFKEETKC